MPKQQTNKVVSIEAKRHEELEECARLLAEACAKSDPSAEARAYVDADLDADPEAWRRHGDLAREAMDLAFRDFWLGYYTKESVRRGAELLKEELGHADAPASERILIEHAVLCHVRLGMVEHLYSRQTSGSYSIAQGEHWERRLTLAQRRFTRAVTTLERVRVLVARAEAARAQAGRARLAKVQSLLKVG